MSVLAVSIRVSSIAIAFSLLGTRAAHAQAAAAKAKHPVVCAKGVRVYTDKAQVPVPHDTVTIPPADGPIRITSPDEAEAAELALRGRAGSAGANAVLVIDEVSGDADAQRVRRTATGLFVPADSVRALQACK